MNKEYYIVVLNNNISRNPLKIDNIIHRSKLIDMPGYTLNNIYENLYEGIEVLAVKENDILKDIITGETISYSSNGIYNGLSYRRIIKANKSDIIRITNIYKNLSDLEIKRYRESIYDIKSRSIRLYNENSLKSLKDLEEEQYAFEYLKYMEECVI